MLKQNKTKQKKNCANCTFHWLGIPPKRVRSSGNHLRRPAKSRLELFQRWENVVDFVLCVDWFTVATPSLKWFATALARFPSSCFSLVQRWEDDGNQRRCSITVWRPFNEGVGELKHGIAYRSEWYENDYDFSMLPCSFSKLKGSVSSIDFMKLMSTDYKRESVGNDKFHSRLLPFPIHSVPMNNNIIRLSYLVLI